MAWHEFTVCDSVYRVLLARYVDMWTHEQMRSAENATRALVAFDVAIVVFAAVYIGYIFSRG